MPSPETTELAHAKFLAEMGVWLVIIGVAGEGVEIVIKLATRKLHFKESFWHWLDVISAIFWIMVVVGLVIEQKGSNRVAEINERDNAELHFKASEAAKQAGFANDRAASNEVRVAELQNENLKVKLKFSRRISMEQKRAFISRLKDQWKVPVKIYICDTDYETETFSTQLRQMLDEAGYAVTNGEGIVRANLIYISPIGDRAGELPLGFIFYGAPNQNIDWGDFRDC